MLKLELVGIINVVAYLTVTTLQLVLIVVVVVLQRLHTAIIRVSREIKSTIKAQRTRIDLYAVPRGSGGGLRPFSPCEIQLSPVYRTIVWG